MPKILNHKTKQFFFVLLKLSIVVCAFYFIYFKLTTNKQLSFNAFRDFLTENHVFSLKNLCFLLVLSVFNWFFEILKWRDLVLIIKNISFYKALNQTLGSLTASLFTPNRVGEYGAKAMYYEPGFRKKIVLLNFLGNMMQLLVTTLFGVAGLFIFAYKYVVDISYLKIISFVFIAVLLMGSMFFILKKKEIAIKGISLEKVIRFFKNIPTKTYILCFIYSVIRYLLFSFQFYFLLYLFQVEISYLSAMIVISSMYLLASIIPSIFIFDVVIKGSVAVYLFSIVGVNQLTILCVITSMWLLNFVIPSIFGSVFVLNFNLPKTVKA